MRKTIVLNKKQESELEQIINELIYSLKKTYSEEDLLNLSYLIVKESSKQTYQSKKKTTVSLFKSIGSYSGKSYKLIKEKINLYNTNGIQNEFNKDFERSKSIIYNSPSKVNSFGIRVKNKVVDFNENFLKKSKEEKIELISVGVMGVLIFFASAGGEDFEGGIPDSDLNLGIGFHRHFISHSIIMGFIVEFLMRTGIEIINKSYKNLPETHHPFWDKTNKYINKHKGIAIGAMWAGISAHLIKDSGLLGHGFKPYVGIPIELSTATHQGLFAANSTASAIFAYNDIKEK